MCIECFFETKIVSVDFSCPVMFPKYAIRYVGGNNIKIKLCCTYRLRNRVLREHETNQNGLFEGNHNRRKSFNTYFVFLTEIISSRNREENRSMKVLRDVQRRSFHCSEDENTSLRRGRRQS